MNQDTEKNPVCNGNQPRTIERRKAVRRAAHAREIALLDSIPNDELFFHGKVIIEKRDIAIMKAKEATSSETQEDLVYFVDGSVCPRAAKPGNPHSRRSAASTVYKRDRIGTYHIWDSMSFFVAQCIDPSPTQAEMAAIAGAMAAATSRVMNLAAGGEEGTAVRRVIIFSDCQPCFKEIQNNQCSPIGRRKLQISDMARRIITNSQVLWKRGIRVELRWVPGHSGAAGNVRADTEAKKMARGMAQGPPARCFEECNLAPRDMSGQRVGAPGVAAMMVPAQGIDITKKKMAMRFDYRKQRWVFSQVRGGDAREETPNEGAPTVDLHKEPRESALRATPFHSEMTLSCNLEPENPKQPGGETREKTHDKDSQRAEPSKKPKDPGTTVTPQMMLMFNHEQGKLARPRLAWVSILEEIDISGTEDGLPELIAGARA